MPVASRANQSVCSDFIGGVYAQEFGCLGAAAAAGVLTVHTAPGGRRPSSAARPLGDFSNGIHE